MTDKKKEEIVELTKEEKERFVEELVFKGGTTYEKTVFDGKLTLLYKTLNGNEQLEVEKSMTNPDGSTQTILHNYSLHLVANSLLRYGDTDLSKMTPKERRKFITKQSNSIIDVIIGGFNEFQKKLQACTRGEILDEVFFTAPSTDSEQS
jgi:hypothetical protein